MSVVIQRWQLWQDIGVSWHKNRRQHYRVVISVRRDELDCYWLYAFPELLSVVFDSFHAKQK